jgi:hypothetical protein
MSQFRVRTSYLNTSNLTDLGASLTPFINNFENINVINTFTGNNAYVNNLTIGGSLTGGTNGQNVYFTGIGIQISGAIFSTNTFIPLIFSKNGKVVTLAFGEADNGIGVGSNGSSMDIFINTGTGVGQIPLSFLPSIIYTGSNIPNGPTFIVNGINNGGSSVLVMIIGINYGRSAPPNLDINIVPLLFSEFDGGAPASLFAGTITYVTDQ